MNGIRMTYDYLQQMAYEWHMSDMRMVYDYTTNGTRLYTIDIRVTRKRYSGDRGVTYN